MSDRLSKISTEVESIGKAVDDLQEHSYQFNLKIVGIPELRDNEAAVESSGLCVKLFNDIGAEVTWQDIDYAHRVPKRTATAGPRPIICKFTRRLARDSVLSKSKDACKADPTHLGFSSRVSLEFVRIFQHLSLQMQNVFSDAKRFKEQHQYQFCWTKGSVVYLRKNPESSAVKIKDAATLQKLERQSSG